MGPKVEAACQFVEETGMRAAIGALGEIRAVVAEDAGTQVYPEGHEP
jgi:carbamate kinase